MIHEWISGSENVEKSRKKRRGVCGDASEVKSFDFYTYLI